MPSYIEIGLSPVAAPHFSDAEVLDAVLRGIRHRAGIVRAEMGLGLSSLAAIASTAAFVGLLGTCFGIINSFCGIGMEKSAALGTFAAFLSKAIVPTALAMAAAIPLLIHYNPLTSKLERIRMKMDTASLALMSVLSLLLTSNRTSSSCSAAYRE